MDIYQFYDSIILWADVVWTERQEEMNNNLDRDINVTDMLEIRNDMNDANPPPPGEFYEDPALEIIKDQVYKQRLQYTSILESGRVKDG